MSFEINVASYNIRNGYDVKHDFSVLAYDILGLSRQIVGLQEVDKSTSRNGFKDTMKELSEYTGYKYYGYSKSIDYLGGEYGTGVLSVFPIESYETFPLESQNSEKRSFSHAVINVQGKKVDFFNTHLSLEDDIRKNQFPILKNEIQKCTSAILTGDFNVKSLSEFDVLCPCKCANKISSVYKTYAHETAIDNIIAFGDFDITGVGMYFSLPEHSDHSMLFATVRV